MTKSDMEADPKRIAEAEHKVLAFLAALIDVGYSGAEIWAAVDLTRAKLLEGRGEKCPGDGKPCYVGDEDNRHHRCGTVQCGRGEKGNNAPAVAAPFDPWQPISTAPKDGTHIIVVNKRQPQTPPATVHWFDARDYGAKSGGAGWNLSVNQMGEYSEYIWGPPTHWMPLPSPPGSDGARPHPTGREDGFCAGIEAAAKVCDEFAKENVYYSARAQWAGNVARAIRALSHHPAGKKEG